VSPVGSCPRKPFKVYRNLGSNFCYSKKNYAYGGGASIDEAYLDVTQSLLLFQSPLHIAQSIKDQIKESEQLTCSIGVAPNKLLAKLGSGLKKPDGLVIIKKEDVEEILGDLPVSKLYGIGPKLTEALNSIGIFTWGQLGRFQVSILSKRFGVIGERLHEMGLGLDDSPVTPFDEEEDARSISTVSPLKRIPLIPIS
jgi:DNA polymerase-4